MQSQGYENLLPCHCEGETVIVRNELDVVPGVPKLCGEDPIIVFSCDEGPSTFIQSSIHGANEYFENSSICLTSYESAVAITDMCVVLDSHHEASVLESSYEENSTSSSECSHESSQAKDDFPGQGILSTDLIGENPAYSEEVSPIVSNNQNADSEIMPRRQQALDDQVVTRSVSHAGSNALKSPRCQISDNKTCLSPATDIPGGNNFFEFGCLIRESMLVVNNIENLAGSELCPIYCDETSSFDFWPPEQAELRPRSCEGNQELQSSPREECQFDLSTNKPASDSSKELGDDSQIADVNNNAARADNVSCGSLVGKPPKPRAVGVGQLVRKKYHRNKCVSRKASRVIRKVVRQKPGVSQEMLALRHAGEPSGTVIEGSGQGIVKASFAAPSVDGDCSQEDDLGYVSRTEKVFLECVQEASLANTALPLSESSLMSVPTELESFAGVQSFGTMDVLEEVKKGEGDSPEDLPTPEPPVQKTAQSNKNTMPGVFEAFCNFIHSSSAQANLCSTVNGGVTSSIHKGWKSLLEQAKSRQKKK